MNETTARDPMSLLKWTSKSIYQVKGQMQKLWRSISKDAMHRRLKELDYSLQANVKAKEGSAHKDRAVIFDISMTWQSNS